MFKHAILGASPDKMHKYRPKEGVPGQPPYPTVNQIKEFTRFMEGLHYEKTPETPFSMFLQHHHYKIYIQELNDLITEHDNGTLTVIRDDLQSPAEQESAFIQTASAKIADIFFAGPGMGVDFETSGAPYQAVLMRRFDWMAALLSNCLSNLPSHSLTRSKWLNGLRIKLPHEQAFVFLTIAKEVSGLYGLSPMISPDAPFIPWMPYYFHAGNHPEQDMTTRHMLKANLAVIPNWTWDVRYSKARFTDWVTRQLDVFAEEGKPLNQIRIKNPGQGPGWNANVIVNLVQTIRQMFKERELDDPIILIHNHEVNGKAPPIAAEAITTCQTLGYPFLIVDSAPPETSRGLARLGTVIKPVQYVTDKKTDIVIASSDTPEPRPFWRENPLANARGSVVSDETMTEATPMAGSVVRFFAKPNVDHKDRDEETLAFRP